MQSVVGHALCMGRSNLCHGMPDLGHANPCQRLPVILYDSKEYSCGERALIAGTLRSQLGKAVDGQRGEDSEVELAGRFAPKYSLQFHAAGTST